VCGWARGAGDGKAGTPEGKKNKSERYILKISSKIKIETEISN